MINKRNFTKGNDHLFLNVAYVIHGNIFWHKPGLYLRHFAMLVQI